MIKRIVLFVITNLAILLALSIALRLLGIDKYIAAGGGLNMGVLLVFAAVIGFGGSLISLALSKWSAKMMVGAHRYAGRRAGAAILVASTIGRAHRCPSCRQRALRAAPGLKCRRRSGDQCNPA